MRERARDSFLLFVVVVMVVARVPRGSVWYGCHMQRYAKC